MFVTMKTFQRAIGIFHSIVWDLRREIKLMKFNQEAEIYELFFDKIWDMYNVYKDWEFFTAFHTLAELQSWFAWYKEWIDNITISIYDECIDNQCIDPIQYDTKKSLSSKKRKND